MNTCGTIANRLEGPCHTEVHFAPRDWTFISSAKDVLARTCVCLALGETNGILQITRSVICAYAREQTLTTAAQNSGRASEQLSERAACTVPFLATQAVNK